MPWSGMMVVIGLRKLKGQLREPWIDVYPTKYEDDDNPEINQYKIRIDQSQW